MYTAPDPEADMVEARFGWAVALSSNTDVLVIGAPRYEGVVGVNSGAVYIYKRVLSDSNTGWALQTKLESPSAAAENQFGYSVDVNDAYELVIGEWKANSDQGAAHVYASATNGSTWLLKSTLTAFNGDASDLFGFSVSISSDMIVVGAKAEDSDGVLINGASGNSLPLQNSGAVYSYHRNIDSGEWQYDAYFKASNTGNGDAFGSAVSVHEDYIAVGAPQERSGNASDGNDNSATFSGAAYIYECARPFATVDVPTPFPTLGPPTTHFPTTSPTLSPSTSPTAAPTLSPVITTDAPTQSPIIVTSAPTQSPTGPPVPLSCPPTGVPLFSDCNADAVLGVYCSGVCIYSSVYGELPIDTPTPIPCSSPAQCPGEGCLRSAPSQVLGCT